MLVQHIHRGFKDSSRSQKDSSDNIDTVEKLFKIYENEIQERRVRHSYICKIAHYCETHKCWFHNVWDNICERKNDRFACVKKKTFKCNDGNHDHYVSFGPNEGWYLRVFS